MDAPIEKTVCDLIPFGLNEKSQELRKLRPLKISNSL